MDQVYVVRHKVLVERRSVRRVAKELGISEEHEGIIILPDDAPVGLPLRDYLGDVVIDIDILPNTARALSILGVAREVAALTGATLHMPEMPLEATGPNVAVPALAHRIEMLRAASSSHSLVRSAGSARSTGRTSTVTPYC